MASTNSLFFPALSTITPSLGTAEKWRMCAKTSNHFDNKLTMDLVFKYINNNSQFNLTNKYMTLFHMGLDSSRSGIEVCLYRSTSDSDPIQIGVRISTGSQWSDLSGSFISLNSIGNINNDYFMIMLQYDYSSSNTIINFYVTQYNNETNKTTPDFTFTTTTAPNITSIGNSWGFGSSPESITDINGYTSTEVYNSYIAQNVNLINLRTWNIVIPITSSDSYAFFNTTLTNYSLYNLNKSQTYVPSDTQHLFFQLYIPTDSDNISELKNNATSQNHPSVVSTDTSFHSLYGFSINGASGFNLITTYDVSCLMKGTKILTDNGYKLVELIQPGDILVTHDDRKTKVVKNKHYNIIGNLESYPYVIKKGNYNAFEDLYLSSGHAILIDNYFVSACQLNIEQDTTHYLIEYYGVQTENFYQDTIIANGVIVEPWDGFEEDQLYRNVEHKFLKEYINQTGHRYLH